MEKHYTESKVTRVLAPLLVGFGLFGIVSFFINFGFYNCIGCALCLAVGYYIYKWSND
jgi:hypothetical protein